jgi:hypothetical protein
MAAYRSRYSKSYQSQGNPRTRFIVTTIVIGLFLYATVFWILPFFVSGVGLVTSVFKTTPEQKPVSEDATLAPPVFNIPFEATNQEVIEIKGYATANSKVELYLDDELKDSLRVGEDGSFTFENVELVLGTNNIYGKTIDDSGKVSLPSKTIRITLDSEEPSLEVSEPEDGKSVQGERRLRIAGKTEVDAKVFINDSQTVVKSDGSFASEISLNDGENLITIKAVDKAGNTTDLGRKATFTP